MKDAAKFVRTTSRMTAAGAFTCRFTLYSQHHICNPKGLTYICYTPTLRIIDICSHFCYSLRYITYKRDKRTLYYSSSSLVTYDK